MIVPDASVVVELLTNGRLADAIRNELAGREESFIAPHLIDVEVLSATRKLLGGRRIGRTRRTMNCQRTANSVLTVCLSPGGKVKGSDRKDLAWVGTVVKPLLSTSGTSESL